MTPRRLSQCAATDCNFSASHQDIESVLKVVTGSLFQKPLSFNLPEEELTSFDLSQCSSETHMEES